MQGAGDIHAGAGGIGNMGDRGNKRQNRKKREKRDSQVKFKPLYISYLATYLPTQVW